MEGETNGQWRRKATVASTAVLLALAAAALILASIGSDMQRSSTLVASTGASSPVAESDSPLASSRAAPTMSLVEIMKSKPFHEVPMLAESDVKRAIVCPRNRKCSFRGNSAVKAKSEVEQFDPVQEEYHSKTDADSSMEILFDVFGTCPRFVFPFW
eukprot:1246644-Rhodomonas_salina.1